MDDRQVLIAVLTNACHDPESGTNAQAWERDRRRCLAALTNVDTGQVPEAKRPDAIGSARISFTAPKMPADLGRAS